jgi:hypothetical protein
MIRRRFRGSELVRSRAYPGRGLFLSHSAIISPSRRYRDCARGALCSPKSDSANATGFLILAPCSASTRRDEPHCQHQKSRGRLSALTMPIWPHCWQTILSSIIYGGGEKAPGDTGG